MARPTTLPDWATNANFATGPIIGQPTKVAPVSGMVQDGFVPADYLRAENVNFQIGNHADWINYLDSNSQWFGDASDGNQASGFGTITLAKDTNYGNLTLSATDLLKSNAYRIFVDGTLTIASGGKISFAGADAPSQLGGLGISDHSLGGSSSGADAVLNNPGGNAGSFSNALGGQGGDGGASSTANAGGSGGIATQLTAAQGTWRNYPNMINAYAFSPAGAVGIQAGGAGGGGGSTAIILGGGGGASGGVVMICARHLVLAGASAIDIHGGAGHAGLAGGGGGGGGGGSGGLALIVYRTCNGTLSSFVNVTGGAAGAGTGGGVNGNAGGTGALYSLVI